MRGGALSIGSMVKGEWSQSCCFWVLIGLVGLQDGRRWKAYFGWEARCSMEVRGEMDETRG